MVRLGPAANTAATSQDQARVAGKLTSTSKLFAALRAAGTPPRVDTGGLVLSTSFLRFYSSCLRFVSGRSPPSDSSTQL